MNNTDEPRNTRIDSLISAAQLKRTYPVSDTVAHHVTTTRERIRRILKGEDARLLVIIGPCSIHDPQAALEYAEKLSVLREKYRHHLEIVMRAYFEKPRTVVGWKGLINDPDLNGEGRINHGLGVARKVLIDINQRGIPTATEFLDRITGRYIVDLISWGAIGARTTESQTHREMASSLPCPIGFKNGTDGNIHIAIDAIRAAGVGHTFLSPDDDGRMSIYQSKGNPAGHLIMRGGKMPNYHAEDIAHATALLARFNLPPRLVVDASHGNCFKQHHRQRDVALAIARQIHDGSDAIAGIMVESFLHEGAQTLTCGQPLIYGQSITDPCLGWHDSADILARLADAVESRAAT